MYLSRSMTKMANFVALALSFCDVRALRNTGTGTDFVGKNGRVPVQGAMGEVFLFLILVRLVVPFSTCCADVVLESAQKHCAQAF